MVQAVSYPGVYVHEVPSGVRTIAGVSTSVTAFNGWAKRGPVNKAIQIFTFSDYERWFGGLDANSELSYSVRQFFLNGGSEAWVVKVAKDASAASLVLESESNESVLEVQAQAQGHAGNSITVAVEHETSVSGSTFNLTIEYTNEDNPQENDLETFENLSMNGRDVRYVGDVVNAGSRFVTVNRLHDASGLGVGTSTSSVLEASDSLVDETHYRLRVSVNGTSPVPVELNVADIPDGDLPDRLEVICAQIESQVLQDVGTNPSLADFTCVPDGSQIVMTSGVDGEESSVRVLPGVGNDATVGLKLGSENGGTEVDAAATIRPTVIPNRGTLTSGDLAGTSWDDDGPAEDRSQFMISLNRGPSLAVDIGSETVSGSDEEIVEALAARIESAVRELQPGVPVFEDFTCRPDESGTRLVLTSGTGGTGSSVRVASVDDDSLAIGLNLADGDVTTADGQDVPLTGGSESMFQPGEAYPTFVGSRLAREGIYALEGVDIFNLLCLPGVTNPGVLSDAASYCQERRAFLIAESPPDAIAPSEMATTFGGTALPKTEYGAVYFPWIEVSDPLRAGRPRTIAPSGTIAGLFSRTDATRGVWKAPAGTEAVLNNVRGVAYKLTDRENGTLNPLGVNCIRVLPGYGAVSWGGRTLRGADQMASEYKYTPVRRTALFIEESLYRGLKWVVFEPNDEPLWAQIRLSVGAFMHGLFRQGAFQGATPREAYFVKCDSESTN